MLGWSDTSRLADATKYQQNLFLGSQAGSNLTAGGAGNVLVGGFQGTAAAQLNQAVALSSADDSVGLWWPGGGRRSPAQSDQGIILARLIACKHPAGNR